jgi:hypothetical protein
MESGRSHYNINTRRSNQEINTDRSINSTRFELTTIGLDATDKSVFIDKPFEKNRKKNNSANTSITRSPKKSPNKFKADPAIFELERLMAYSEVKYREDVHRAQRTIARNKMLSNLSVACLMYEIHYLIIPWKRFLQKVYFFKWIAKIKSVNKRQRRLIKRIETRRHRAVKLMDKVCKRTMVFGLYTFKERCWACYMARVSEYQTEVKSLGDSYANTPFESYNKVPVENELISSKFKTPVKITSSLYKQPSKAKDLDEETKREYKRSIKAKYHSPDKFVEKAMGLSYYR